MSASLEVGGGDLGKKLSGDKNVFATRITSAQPDVGMGVTAGQASGGN